MALEGLEPVFGFATGKVQGRESSAFLPLLFRLHAPDDDQLSFAITDFQDNTWECSRSLEQLQDLRDETGIAGAWSDFVDYVRAAFLSDNVVLTLGGPASAFGGAGATSARATAIKSKGMPRISFGLNKLTGVEASDRMSDIAVHNCKSWQALTQTIGAAKAQSEELKAALRAEQLKSRTLEEQLDNLRLGPKKKQQPPQLQQQSKPASPAVEDTSSVIAANTTLSQQEPAVADNKKKARRVAPVSSRMKRKGTVIGDEEE